MGQTTKAEDALHPLVLLRESLGREYRSRAKFADLAGVAPETIWAIENHGQPGKKDRFIGFEVLVKLARATGKSEDELRELFGDQVRA